MPTPPQNLPSTEHYRVVSCGLRCWYVQCVADNSLVGVSFRTKKAATDACARRNLPVELKNLPQAEFHDPLAGQVRATVERPQLRVIQGEAS